MLAPLLAMALTAGTLPNAMPAGPLDGTAGEGAPQRLLQYTDDEEYRYEDEGSGRSHVRVTGWGGALIDLEDGGGVPFGGAEVAWIFSAFDLGFLAQAYNFGSRAKSDWAPVLLARFEQRFETLRGVDAMLSFGLGAARTDGWQTWFQVAFGFRASSGPLFLAGELGFEQDQLFRLAAGVGVSF